MPKKKTDFTIIVDTREQHGYLYKGAVKGTLKTGDYSIVGLEDKITIERKTKPDAFGSFGKGRPRLKKEFERLSEYRYGAIVLEMSLGDILQPPAFTKMSPKVIINTLISWSIRYNVHVWFGGNRDHSEALTYRILEKFWRYWDKMIEEG